MKNMRTAMMAAGSALCLGSTAASAIELSSGDWTLNINGNVNVHYINNNCDDRGNVTVLGGVTCPAFGLQDGVGVLESGGGGDDRTSGVATGLLPSALVFNLSTTQMDWADRQWDLNAVFGFYPGVVSNDNANLDSGQTLGLQSASIDTRQVYLQFANDRLGTIKMGRDFGLFGYDAIINDMTLPGVGVQGFQAPTPNNTTLGSIGYGYIYTDTLSQITYTTPMLGCLTVKAGIFQPLDAVDFAGTGGAGGTPSAFSAASSKSEPGFHGSLRCDISTGAASGFVSVNGITQEHTGLRGANITDPNGESGRSKGVDVNALIELAVPMQPTILASYYRGDGMGTTALFFDGFDDSGDERESYGYLLQGTFNPIPSTKIGFNYGLSHLDDNAGDPGTLVEENRKWTVGVYHTFTPNLMFLAEFSDATSENHAGDDYSASNFNLGAFLSF